MSYLCREIQTAFSECCQPCCVCLDQALTWAHNYLVCCFCCVDDSEYEFSYEQPPTACDRLLNIFCCCIADDQQIDPLFNPNA